MDSAGNPSGTGTLTTIPDLPRATFWATNRLPLSQTWKMPSLTPGVFIFTRI